MVPASARISTLPPMPLPALCRIVSDMLPPIACAVRRLPVLIVPPAVALTAILPPVPVPKFSPAGLNGKGFMPTAKRLMRPLLSMVDPFVAVNVTLLARALPDRSEEHTSELQSLMRISYAVFGLKKKKQYDTLPI